MPHQLLLSLETRFFYFSFFFFFFTHTPPVVAREVHARPTGKWDRPSRTLLWQLSSNHDRSTAVKAEGSCGFIESRCIGHRPAPPRPPLLQQSFLVLATCENHPLQETHGQDLGIKPMALEMGLKEGRGGGEIYCP